jgi:signal transduction histidine kinase
MNYLSNALKFSPENRDIVVNVAVEEPWVRVSVKDAGSGVPESEQERIWQRFYRSAETEARSGSRTGLGLGLHICKAAIEAHDGHVGVDSVLGKGSTFWFIVPLAPTLM